MDSGEITKFLARLYDDGDTFEVAYIKPGGKVARVNRLYPDPVLTDEFERAENDGYNVYVSALPSRLKHPEPSSVYDRVWVDMDDPDAPWPSAR